jgi:lipopolysaccharide/colanic/teichoic acid biosynthesis glycosyltransferase
MLRVLRHYLPLRRALLIFSETAWLGAVLAAGMTAHLWRITPGSAVLTDLAQRGLGVADARNRCLISALMIAVLSQIAIAFNELYDIRISNSRFDRAARFVTSTVSAIVLALAATLIPRWWGFERMFDFPGLSASQLVQTLVFTMLFGFALLYLWRHAFHFALHRWNFNERVLILGAGPAGQSLVQVMLERPDSGYQAVGLVPETREQRSGGYRGLGVGAPPELPRVTRSPTAPPPAPTGSELEHATAIATLILDPLPAPAPAANGSGNGHGNRHGNGHGAQVVSEPLVDLVRRLDVGLVCVALEDRRGHLPTEELLKCRLAGIGVKEREALYEQITGKIAVEAMRPSYLIFNDGFGRSAPGEIAKRATDLVLSALGLVIAWPVMLAVAIAVRLDSEGPILFKQERVGGDGKVFTVFKFRSMRSDAEKLTGPVWASADDPRVTRCGRFLRRTRLDELPQLFNVLSGDMSLVGPRPERPVFVAELARQIPYYIQRHIVKPGLTGWAQINYPYGNTVDDALQKLQYDLFYIKYQSLLFDLSIVFHTVKTVLLRKGT